MLSLEVLYFVLFSEAKTSIFRLAKNNGGIDGGYVRSAHKQGWFEVITGKSVVALRRENEGEVPSAKCFGLAQTYDEKPRRRLWEMMKSNDSEPGGQIRPKWIFYWRGVFGP
jgi:hypothetical protein